mgnify:CR=1 FL=1
MWDVTSERPDRRIKRLRKAGHTVSWDFGWSETLALRPELPALLDALDLVFVNELEAPLYAHVNALDDAYPPLRARTCTVIVKLGALGSRRTQERRVERLLEAGLEDAAIARIHAPCGLDMGARTPSETAISVLAEIIALRTGRSAAPLRETTGPIHPTEAEGVAASDGTVA